MTEASHHPGAGRILLLLLPILALAGVCRWIPLEAEFPFLLRCPEEQSHVERALNISQGELNPGFFFYPSLHFYLMAATLRLAHGSDVDTPEQASWEVRHARSSRRLSLGLGVGSVLAMFLAGWALGGPSSAAVAGLLTAVNPVHVRVTTATQVDASLSFFFCWVLLGLILVSKRPRLRTCVLVGLGAGLAISSKQAALGLVPLSVLAVLVGTRHESLSFSPPRRRLALALIIILFALAAVALLLRQFALPILVERFTALAELDPARADAERQRMLDVGASALGGGGLAGIAIGTAMTLSRRLRAVIVDRRVVLAVIGGLLMFALTSPYMWIDWRQSARDLTTLVSQGTLAGLGKGVLGGTWHYARFLLDEFGAVWLIGACGFAVVAILRRMWTAVVVAAAASVYFFGFVDVATPHHHYVLPAAHAMDLLAAGGVALLVSRIVTRRRQLAVFAALTVVVVAKPAASSVSWSRHVMRPHVRVAALEWIEAHVPPGSSIARVKWTPQLEILGDRYRVYDIGFRTGALVDSLRADSMIEYVVWADDILHPGKHPRALSAEITAAAEHIADLCERVQTISPPSGGRGRDVHVYRVR